MKKLCIMAFTVALLAWASVSQATILSSSYQADGTALNAKALWDGDSQLTIQGTQTALAASASGQITTDTDEDPSMTFGQFLNNDTTMTWTGYQILISANKSISLSNAVVYDPAGWSIGVSATSPDGKEWEVDVFDRTGKASIAPGGELDFSYQMNFSGGLQYTAMLSPLGTIAVPEPTTLVLVLSGLLGLAALRVSRRRRP